MVYVGAPNVWNPVNFKQNKMLRFSSFVGPPQTLSLISDALALGPSGAGSFVQGRVCVSRSPSTQLEESSLPQPNPAQKAAGLPVDFAPKSHGLRPSRHQGLQGASRTGADDGRGGEGEAPIPLGFFGIFVVEPQGSA